MRNPLRRGQRKQSQEGAIGGAGARRCYRGYGEGEKGGGKYRPPWLVFPRVSRRRHIESDNWIGRRSRGEEGVRVAASVLDGVRCYYLSKKRRLEKRKL